jgi:hypothetical protein
MRFLVFAYQDGEGGAHDFNDAFRTFNEARDHAAKLLIVKYYKAHIFDTDTLKIVWSEEDFDRSSE